MNKEGKNRKVVALLPMKDNSERVPNKNLKDFCGKPLFRIMLDTLLESKYISKIIVNTDSDRIKSGIALNYENERVQIHDRPNEIQGDMVSMNKIIAYDLEKSNADFYLQTHSTNPLLKTASVDAALEKMFELNTIGKYDSIFSVTRIQTRLYDQKGNPFNHDPKVLLRTQDLPPLFEENSNLYIFTKESFKASGGKRIGAAPFMFETDKIEAIDIDELQDFILAEALYKQLNLSDD